MNIVLAWRGVAWRELRHWAGRRRRDKARPAKVRVSGCLPRDEPDLMPAPAVCPTIRPSYLGFPHQLIGAGA